MSMRTDPYADLVRRERALPALPLLFDTARLARVLEQQADATITRIDPVYIRYKRRTSCLVAYTVTGSMGASSMYAKALRTSSMDKLEKGVARGGADTWLGSGPFVLRDLAVSFRANPNDAKLKRLRYVSDAPGRATLLRRVPGDLGVPASHPFETLSYKPERRFVAALRGQDGTPRAVLKMYTASGYEDACARSNQDESADVLRVPARLARDERRRLLYLEWLPGRSAADVIGSDEALNGRMCLVGRALAELHNQPIASSTATSPSFDTSAAFRVICDVQVLFPSLAATLDRLRSELAAVSGGLRAPAARVHGDFHPRQVLLSPSGVGIVDFDRAGAGEAAADLGYFRANLERDVLAGAVSRERAEDVMDELLRGYGELRPRPLSSVLDLQTAAALALLLPEPFRHCHPNSIELTTRILDRALALIAHSETRMALR